MAGTRTRNRVGWGGGTVVSAATADSLDLLSYDPNPTPEDPADLGRYVNDELFRIRDTFYEILDNMSSNSDMMLSIAKGDVGGHSSVNKFGRNQTIANSATEDIWDGSSSYLTTPGFPTTAVITHAWSAVNSAATQGLVIEVQGLDENWAEATDTVTLNAANSTTATAFDSATTFIRVFRMRVIDSTQADQNIQCGDSGKANYYAQITAGENQTQMAIYTVPANKTAYMTNYYASCNEVAARSIEGTIKLYTIDRENNYTNQTKHVLGLDEDATSVVRHEFAPYFKITQKTDIVLQFANAVAAVADVSAGFDLILVDDGY